MTQRKAKNWYKKFQTLFDSRDLELVCVSDNNWGLKLTAISNMTYAEEFQMKDLWTILTK